MTIPTISEIKGNTILQLLTNAYNTLKNAILRKQNKLIAGDNIVIDENTNRISAIVGGEPVLTDYYTKSETYSKNEVNGLLEDKADSDNVWNKDSVYTKTDVDTLLADKADTEDVYTKSEIDTIIEGVPTTDNIYTKSETYNKTEVDNLVTPKANSTDVYTKTQTDTLLSNKANASTVYSKSAVDTLLEGKANVTNVYSKSENDSLLSAKADKSTTYTKTEVDSKLSLKEDKKSWKVYVGSISDFSLLESYGYIVNNEWAYAKFSKDTLLIIRDQGNIASFEFKAGIEYRVVPNPVGGGTIDRLEFTFGTGDIDSRITASDYLNRYRFSIGSNVTNNLVIQGISGISNYYTRLNDIRDSNAATRNFTIYVKEV